MKQWKFFYVVTILFLQMVYLSGSFTVTGFSEDEARKMRRENKSYEISTLKNILLDFLEDPQDQIRTEILEQINYLKTQHFFDDVLTKNLNGTGSLLEIFMDEPSILMMLFSNLGGDSKIFEIKDRDRNNILHKLAYKVVEHQGSFDGKKEKYLELMGMLQVNNRSKYNKLFRDKNVEAIDPLSIINNDQIAIAFKLFDKIKNTWSNDNNVRLQAISELKAYCNLLKKKKILQYVIWKKISGTLLFDYFKDNSELLNILFFYMTNFSDIFEYKNMNNLNILQDIIDRILSDNYNLNEKHGYFNCLKFLQNENPAKFEELMLIIDSYGKTSLEKIKNNPAFLEIVQNFNLSKVPFYILNTIIMTACINYNKNVIDKNMFNKIMHQIKDQCSFELIQKAFAVKDAIVLNYLNDLEIFKDILFNYFSSNEALEKLGGIDHMNVLLQIKINQNERNPAWVALKDDFNKNIFQDKK